jgi:hypothetical protein
MIGLGQREILEQNAIGNKRNPKQRMTLPLFASES